MERLVKRNTEMETCCNNIKLLTEMLNHYGPSSPAQDKELMKVHCGLFFLFSIYVPHLVVTNISKDAQCDLKIVVKQEAKNNCI